jgi:hypothetical protein
MPDPRLAPLLALMRVRHIGLTEARRALVARLDAQTEAERHAAEIERRMATEAAAAADLSACDGAVEAFGRWLGVARLEAAAAEAERARTQAETTIARARLAASRFAVEAVRTVVEAREMAAEAEAMRNEQAVIDELTRSRPPR